MSDLFAAAEARQAAVAQQAAATDSCFIEQQLPISKLSKETYKERKANAGQTLTALGSYWKAVSRLFWCALSFSACCCRQPMIRRGTARSSSN